MTSRIESTAWTLAVMNIMVAIMLFIGGFITPQEVPAIHRIMSLGWEIDSDVRDVQKEGFQPSLFIEDETGESLGNPTGEDYAVTALDFLEQIPLIGNVITFFRILYEILYTAAFGVVVVAGKVGLPNQIIVIISAFYYVIYSIAIYSFIRKFIAARGGGT